MFVATFILIICACIICISLNAKSSTASSDSTGTLDLSSISALKLNSITSKKVIKHNNDLNIELSAKKNAISEHSESKKTSDNSPSLSKPSQAETVSAPNADYTSLYPNLYVKRPDTQILPPKTAFLTFDDGPSERTAEILDILKQRNIKATFFVTGKTTEFAKSMMRRIVTEGHTIAVHTYTHDFKQIYSSVQAYLDDFNRIYTLIYDVTGVKPDIFRFPGGSKNGFNKNNYREFINEMTRRGFDYFDWNVSSGDAVSRTPTPADVCTSNVLNHCSNLNSCVVLMHDLRPKTTTVQALPNIIDGLEARGFKFDKLSHNIDPSSFSLVRPYR